MEDIPTFAMDVLEEVKATLGSGSLPRNNETSPMGVYTRPVTDGRTNRHISFKDPITGADVSYESCGDKQLRRYDDFARGY